MLGILIALIFANPVNEVHTWLPRELQADATYRQPSTAWLQSSKITNYGVFAFEHTYTTIRVIGLSTSEDLCYMYIGGDFFQEGCAFIGKYGREKNWKPEFLYGAQTPHTTSHPSIASNFCHGKGLLDWNDLPYSTCQLVSMLLVGSMLLSFCAFGLPVLRAPAHPWIDSVLSMTHDISIIDVIRWNLIGYPALKAMRNLLSSPFYPIINRKEFTEVHFVIGCLILIVGLGGTANYLGNRLKQNERVSGIDGLLAACLGYNIAIGKSLLFTFMSTRITNVTYFWLEAVHLFVLGRHGLLIALLTGGTLGHAFGIMHYQWLIEYTNELLRLDWRRFLFGY
jgi:hypothetical protein